LSNYWSRGGAVAHQPPASYAYVRLRSCTVSKDPDTQNCTNFLGVCHPSTEIKTPKSKLEAISDD